MPTLLGSTTMLLTIIRRLFEPVVVWLRSLIIAYSHANAKPALIEKHAVHQSPRRVDELVKIFIHATRVNFWWPKKGSNGHADPSQMETGFWDMAGAAGAEWATFSTFGWIRL
jgi:hypothetical protein